MSMNTGGPVRGFIARWLMRVQAVQGTLQLLGVGVTAASTLTSALVALGHGAIAPVAIGVGVAGAPIYAYAYTELGILNRQNREAQDRANNFATPRDKIDDVLIGAGVFGAVHGRPPDEEELQNIVESVDRPWQEFRNGVDLQSAQRDGNEGVRQRQ